MTIRDIILSMGYNMIYHCAFFFHCAFFVQTLPSLILEATSIYSWVFAPWSLMLKYLLYLIYLIHVHFMIHCYSKTHLYFTSRDLDNDYFSRKLYKVLIVTFTIMKHLLNKQVDNMQLVIFYLFLMN